MRQKEHTASSEETNIHRGVNTSELVEAIFGEGDSLLDPFQWKPSRQRWRWIPEVRLMNINERMNIRMERTGPKNDLGTGYKGVRLVSLPRRYW